MEITYTAKDKLKAGVTAGDQVTIEFSNIDYNIGLKSDKQTSTSMGGVKQTTGFSALRTYQITGFRDDSFTFEDWQQFLYSVKFGEIFTLIDWDTDNVVNVVMTGNADYQRLIKYKKKLFKYSFTCEEQPN